MILGRQSLQRLALGLPGFALCLMGAGIGLIARGQPAWFGTDVGPGLMAQLLGNGVMALGALWAVWCMARPRTQQSVGCGDLAATTQHHASGPALLGAVFLFALVLPVLGLVLSAGLASALAAIGAGERHPLALLVTVLGLTGLTAIIGMLFLPPTAPLWPIF